MKKEVLDFIVTTTIFFIGRLIYESLDKGTTSFTLAFGFGFFTMVITTIIRADFVIRILQGITQKQCKNISSNQEH